MKKEKKFRKENYCNGKNLSLDKQKSLNGTWTVSFPEEPYRSAIDTFIVFNNRIKGKGILLLDPNDLECSIPFTLTGFFQDEYTILMRYSSTDSKYRGEQKLTLNAQKDKMEGSYVTFGLSNNQKMRGPIILKKNK